MLKLEDTRILENKQLIGDFYVLKLVAPDVVEHARPGQFINILISNETDPLLRRPFSIYDADKKTGELKILYCVKGKGTNILKKIAKGETLSITGPHGNGFHVHDKHNNILLVGGGFGTAPLSYLAKENKDKNVYVAIGGRTKDLILCEDDFENHGAKVFVTTDDGSYGEQGIVTKAVEQIIKDASSQNVILSSKNEESRKNKKGFLSSDLDDKLDSGQARMTGEGINEIFTCGPLPMMKAVSKISEKNNIPCQVSMEERMACGVGACYGCVCGTKEGYKTVCANGPVFQANEISW